MQTVKKIKLMKKRNRKQIILCVAILKLLGNYFLQKNVYYCISTFNLNLSSEYNQINKKRQRAIHVTIQLDKPLTNDYLSSDINKYF